MEEQIGFTMMETNHTKTLMDLEKIDNGKFVLVDDLVTAAVSWIKEFSNATVDMNLNNGYGVKIQDAEREIKWVKHFFNIQEDDLI